jgi:hypothetical protein
MSQLLIHRFEDAIVSMDLMSVTKGPQKPSNLAANRAAGNGQTVAVGAEGYTHLLCVCMYVCVCMIFL